ncbi:MAG: hypothetical protein ACE5RF_09225 [Nitrosarchaeum sp.]
MKKTIENKIDNQRLLSLAKIVSPLVGVAIYSVVVAPNYDKMNNLESLENDVRNVLYERNGFHYNLNTKLSANTARFEDYYKKSR